MKAGAKMAANTQHWTVVWSPGAEPWWWDQGQKAPL